MRITLRIALSLVLLNNRIQKLVKIMFLISGARWWCCDTKQQNIQDLEQCEFGVANQIMTHFDPLWKMQTITDGYSATDVRVNFTVHKSHLVCIFAMINLTYYLWKKSKESDHMTWKAKHMFVTKWNQTIIKFFT